MKKELQTDLKLQKKRLVYVGLEFEKMAPATIFFSSTMGSLNFEGHIMWGWFGRIYQDLPKKNPENRMVSI